MYKSTGYWPEIGRKLTGSHIARVFTGLFKKIWNLALLIFFNKNWYIYWYPLNGDLAELKNLLMPPDGQNLTASIKGINFRSHYFISVFISGISKLTLSFSGFPAILYQLSNDMSTKEVRNYEYIGVVVSGTDNLII